MAYSGRWPTIILTVLGLAGIISIFVFGFVFYPDKRADRHIIARVAYLPDAGSYLAPERPGRSTEPHRFRISFPGAPKDDPLNGFVYGNLAAGETIESRFLFGVPYDDVMHFEIGTKFELWKDRQVGYGEVIAIKDSIFVHASIYENVGNYFTPSRSGEPYRFHLAFSGVPNEDLPVGFIYGDLAPNRGVSATLRLANPLRDGTHFKVGTKFQLWSIHHVGSGEVVAKQDPGRPRNVLEAAAQAAAVAIIEWPLPILLALVTYPLVGQVVVGGLACALVWFGRNHQWHGALVAIPAIIGLYWQVGGVHLGFRERFGSGLDVRTIGVCLESAISAVAILFLWLRRI